METFCYKEHALVIDTEVIPKQKEKTEKERLDDFEKLVSEGQAGTLGKFSKLIMQVNNNTCEIYLVTS